MDTWDNLNPMDQRCPCQRMNSQRRRACSVENGDRGDGGDGDGDDQQILFLKKKCVLQL